MGNYEDFQPKQACFEERIPAIGRSAGCYCCAYGRNQEGNAKADIAWRDRYRKDVHDGKRDREDPETDPCDCP